MRIARLLTVTAIILFGIVAFNPANAQIQMPRIGFGLNSAAGTQDPVVGMGFDARVSWPINQDFSIAGGTGVIGYVFQGREESSYFLTPQASAILTLDATNVKSPYFIAGVGGHFSIGSKDRSEDSGPTVHAGLGWTLLLQDTAIYLEISPTLIVARSSASALLPLRVGVVL